ncbi:glycosyltransferase family 2 protein [Candidatus Atribacteria bacterium HGW-Atribacteria-1]|nr:MAG: glycosyltransferase family 2 protein [Candidatus Atribacteria bacterium HGW-Atribacteria-1]
MKDKDLPLVSIIIPCRNEEKYIGRCLNSIIAQDYPKDKLEVLVVDGRSEDGTREIVKEYTEKCSFIKLLDNPRRATPFAMNKGIKKASGDVIILVNAHSILDKGFLKYNIEYLKKTGADAVGGRLSTINDDSSIIAQSIPLAADSIFGAGGRRYRNRIDEGWVKDTLPYCAYPRKIFNKIGLIDEELIRDQDEEFNYRLLKSGGGIFFTPKIKSHLQIRPSLKKLWRQYFQYGCFKVRVAQKVGAILTWRQLIPAVFVGSLIFTCVISFISKFFLWLFLLIAGSYLFANLGFSLSIVVKKGLKFFPVLPVVFAALHFSYGFGFLKGIWDFVICKKHLKKKIEDVPLTR